MKILHTADIHLRSADDERWAALEHILALANRRDVALIVISGDLFDRRIDGQNLKIPVRELFARSQARIVILPGNHDAPTLSAGDFYGENVTILSNAGEHIDIDNVRLFGLPFEKILGEDVIKRLLSIRTRLKPGAANVVLYHGELLDLIYQRESFGDEEELGYMPVRLSYFDDLGIDYVLAGHFHTNFEVQKYSGGYFVYPGSPVSITKKEVGERNVNLFKVGDPPLRLPLDVSHFEDLVVSLSPFARQDPIAEIEHRIRSCHPRARILLTVTGFVDLAERGQSEEEFAAAIKRLETPQVESVRSCWRNISTVRESDLFNRFLSKLDQTTLSDDRKAAIRDLAMASMMEAQSAH